MKVLYAEDEQQLSVAVSEIMKMEGFEVTCVFDGQQAWDAIQSEYFDAVVLDIMMPKMDGIEVLSRMRKAEDHTPVMMLTAKTTVEDRVSGLAYGADDYLGKPFAMQEFIARLNALVRRGSDYRHDVFSMKNVVLVGATCELRTEAGSLRLNNAETELLSHFIKNPNLPYMLDEINELLWKGEESPEKAELYIFYLNNKLRQIHAEIAFVGDDKIGYRLEEK